MAGSIVSVLSAAQQAEYRDDSILVSMGYGALGHQPEDWKGVSLDRPVYFENTYLGGNARLAWLDRLATPLRLGHELVAPHRAVSWPDLPFDAPERGAVSLAVDASEAHVPAGEKRRVFLQVGIAGTEDAAWRRPPASVVLLPLLSDASTAELTRAVETLRSGLESRDLVAVASASGGLVFGVPTARDGDL
ncbi:MAG: hypothetical protein JRH11_21775, partial [Deltaproteobacteria bacterium]|nr:hypothetical protein [Deltaproteobacteria bacterium]